MRADRVLYGKVITLDRESTLAEGVAIAAGRILAVGTRTRLEALRGPGTVVDDFGGAAIIPGFNDTHAHMDSLGMQAILPSLAGARSIADILARIRALAATTNKGAWIAVMPVGDPPFHFDPLATIAEHRMPTRHELDAAAPDHPVYICAPSGYWGGIPVRSALNSLGLQRNGIDRSTRPSAAGIEIELDAAGEPTGVIVEQNFANLAEMDLLPAVPRLTTRDRLGAVRNAQHRFHAVGTTSIYEGHGSTPELLAIYRELHERGELTMRVNTPIAPTWGTLEEARLAMRDWLPLVRGRGCGDARLRVAGVFIGFGGDPAVARLQQRNLADTGWYNMVMQANSAEDYEALCLLAAEHDLRVHTVASDNIDKVLPIMERIAQRYPIGARRWLLEHLSYASPDIVRRLKAIGVATSLIPVHQLWKVATRFAHLTGEALDYLVPAKQLFEAGVPVSAGTDAIPHNPLFCLWVMTAREERLFGRVMGAPGRVSNETALRLLTAGGAWLSFEEHEKGAIAPGFHADLAVLARDPLETHGKALQDIGCVATIVGGRDVHRA